MVLQKLIKYPKGKNLWYDRYMYSVMNKALLKQHSLSNITFHIVFGLLPELTDVSEIMQSPHFVYFITTLLETL